MIDFEVLEPGIIIYRWVDIVTMHEAEDAFATMTAAMPQQPYVALLDLSELKRPPTDLVHMRDNIRLEIIHGLKAYMIFGGNLPVGIFLRTIKRLAVVEYYVANDYQAALVKARDTLRGYMPVNIPT